mmetsp:Transcript_8585/g.10038  ORF Transcript_8585/g.10038 Transcript_8585/m.10038 type:complete len:260 (+) Transcript_8585:85-864(+)
MVCIEWGSGAGSHSSLGDLDLLGKLVLEGLGDLHLAVLRHCVLQLAVHLHLHEGVLVVGSVLDLEDTAVVLVAEVSEPEAARLRHELVLQVQVPVLVLAVELEVLALRHIVHRHYSVILIHRVVLQGRRCVRHHLLEMVDLMDVLGFVPEAVGLVDEDQVLVLGVDHLADVVHMHVLQQDEYLAGVHGVGGARKGTFTTVLHVHVLVVVTVPVTLQLPAATVLELLGDLPPVEVVGEPVEGGSAISRVDLEDVEARSEA